LSGTRPPKEITASRTSDIGAAIVSARTAARLSQQELAAKLKTSRSNVIRLEIGRSIPSTTTLQRIAKATGHKLVISFTK
jgi:transcriptional regulator with XRE-family HTH domain